MKQNVGVFSLAPGNLSAVRQICQSLGDYMAAKIAGLDIFVLRDRTGGLKSFHNLCSHRAAPLFAEGPGHAPLPLSGLGLRS